MTDTTPKPPFRMLGEPDAASCVDGFCAVEPPPEPTSPPSDDLEDDPAG